ncbi:M1 family metallopeptidase [Cytophagia bacterium CHB2]|nr:M1 family metallopeptidase [Cytophagia bacterium CHB2]
MKSLTLFLLLILPGGHVLAQPTFTRADSLRGMLTPLRTCYDIHYYHLDVKIDTTTKSLVGSNVIAFTATQDFDRMQVDLFENFKIEKIVLDDGRPLSFEREANAVFIQMPETLRKNARHHATVFYSGMPQIARRPPWEGGFSWQRDELGNPWLAVTCQGTGASVWWPNKDHQSDEPDSMLLSVTVPKGLMNISNGRLRAQTDLPGNWTRFDWFIS